MNKSLQKSTGEWKLLLKKGEIEVVEIKNMYNVENNRNGSRLDIAE